MSELSDRDPAGVGPTGEEAGFTPSKAAEAAEGAAESGPVLGVMRSLKGRFWSSRCRDDRLALAIAQRAGTPEVIGRVLAGRGVALEAAERYLSPSLRNELIDPHELADMESAAERLARAVIAGEKIAIFGDYDVDGATSSALLRHYLRAVGADPLIYIPDRVREGYGPNTPAMRHLAEQGAKVVVTVDCGMAAHEPLAAAKEAGLEVIVADHHQAPPELPEAFAIVNPNRVDDTTGLGQLAAVGVAYLLVIALNRKLRALGHFGADKEPDLLQWLDLVALGTVADVVPLTGLNRALVAQGLKIMARRQNVGLASLGDVARLNGKPTPYHLGFLLGPRVNAGGRVGEADLGVRLLTSSSPAEATELAARLDALNKERQALEAEVLQAAIAKLDQEYGFSNTEDLPPVLVVGDHGWHPGVVGIVASRLKERYKRPAIVVAFDDGGEGKGSGRSVQGVDLGAAIAEARQAGILIAGGGHAMAAGLTMRASHVKVLQAFLGQRLAEDVAKSTEMTSLKLDGVMALAGANGELSDLLEQAGPYGSGNPEPCFAWANVRIVNAGLVGNAHVRCVVAAADGTKVKGIAFRAADTPLGDCLLAAQKSGPIHLAAKLKRDDWQGGDGVQLMIEDAAPATSGRI